MARRRLLIVDGYNLMHQMFRVDESTSYEDARDRLIARLADYAGFSGQRVIVVFDAYGVQNRRASGEMNGPVEVVYTSAGELADHYIERYVDGISGDISLGRIEVRVATSDLTEQTVVLARGAIRVSSRELIREMSDMKTLSREKMTPAGSGKNPIEDSLPPDIREKLKAMTRKPY